MSGIIGMMLRSTCMVRRGCGSDENKTKLLCAACYLNKLDDVKELVEQYKVDPKGET